MARHGVRRCFAPAKADDGPYGARFAYRFGRRKKPQLRAKRRPTPWRRLLQRRRVTTQWRLTPTTASRIHWPWRRMTFKTSV